MEAFIVEPSIGAASIMAPSIAEASIAEGCIAEGSSAVAFTPGPYADIRPTRAAID